MNGSHGYGPSPYGASPPPGAYGYGAAPSPAQFAVPTYPQAGYGAPPMGMPMANQKNPGLAIMLELLGGFFFQTFGIGHLYSGNLGVGLGLMFGYWALTAINFVLCFVFVGFITWPLTWIAFMILAPITANNAAKRANEKAAMGMAY